MSKDNEQGMMSATMQKTVPIALFIRRCCNGAEKNGHRIDGLNERIEDWNRTVPVESCGNRFEFRVVDSSRNLRFALAVLNNSVEILLEDDVDAVFNEGGCSDDWLAETAKTRLQSFMVGVETIALHCGEDRESQSEWNDRIEFHPERLEYSVHVNDESLAQIVAVRTPVETCFMCHDHQFGVPLEQNVFRRFFPTDQVALYTDNPSFLGTILSREWTMFIGKEIVNLDLNRVLAQIISSLTAILCFNGALNVGATDLRTSHLSDARDHRYPLGTDRHPGWRSMLGVVPSRAWHSA